MSTFEQEFSAPNWIAFFSFHRPRFRYPIDEEQQGRPDFFEPGLKYVVDDQRWPHLFEQYFAELR
jgi:hypothetical protein